MYQYDMNRVFRLTGFSPETRESLARYYIALPEPARMESHKLQTDLIRQARTGNTSTGEPEFFYAQFLIALHKMRSLETGAGTRSKKEPTAEELEKIEIIRKGRIRMEHRKKRRPVKKMIEVRFYELVERFRGEGLSWRDISKYIARFHRCQVSHTYLKKCFDEIAAERKAGKGGI